MQALLRRLEKRIYVSLPDEAARTHMFTRLLKDRGLSSEQLSNMSSQTCGHSGSDIASLCKEIAMRSVLYYLSQFTHMPLEAAAISSCCQYAQAQCPQLGKWGIYIRKSAVSEPKPVIFWCLPDLANPL